MRESVRQADGSIRQTGSVKRRRDDLYLVGCCVTGRGRGGCGRVVQGRGGWVAGSVNVAVKMAAVVEGWRLNLVEEEDRR